MTLLLLGVACSTGLGPEKPDGDGRGARCVPATEIPYDGVDQDCDGADLTDVDGDGADAAEAGGGDCADDDATVRPGAEEVPYDGIDQDCDGADLTDVDGDGHDATAAGGDDCDDTVATTHPAAGEWEKADGVDNDCDGFIDEVDICPDGSGDELTIQRGVDVVADGGTVLLCPATYAENVTVDKARRFAIVGGGAHPDDVAWGGAVEESTLYVEEAEVAVEWLTMTSLAGSAIEGGTGALLSARFVSFGDSTGVEIDSTEQRGEVLVSGCRFTGRAWVGGAVDVGTVVVQGSVFESDAWVGTFGSSPEEPSTILRDLRVQNSVFAGGRVNVATTEANAGVSLALLNNTFANASLVLYASCAASGAEDYVESCFKADVGSNVFYALTPDMEGWPLFLLRWYGFSFPRGSDRNRILEQSAPSFARNVIWDLGHDYLFEGDFVPYCAYSDIDCVQGWAETDYSETVAEASIAADPAFEPGVAGSYTLAASSPARDIDPSGSDPDGTPADAGAFGGPDGDWWKEYPWPLP